MVQPTTKRVVTEHSLATPGQPGHELMAAAVDARTRSGKRPVGRDELVINVQDYGAKGDGVTDDTDAITAAWNVRQAIHFPAGTYVYNGPGLARPSDGAFLITGTGARNSRIMLGPNSYLVDDGVRFIRESRTAKLYISGGRGLIRLRRTGVQVSGYHLVEDCVLDGFTRTAIGHEANDFPYWKIRRCQFYGDTSYASTIAIALRGLTDNVTIEDCEFLRVRIAIKLGDGGNNAKITRCGFLHFATTAPNTPRVAIWVVPQAGNTNSGTGLVVSDNKFGPENSIPTDKRILYADSDAASATLWSEQMPTMNAASTGFISGHVVKANGFALAAGVPQSLVYSMTPNVRAMAVVENVYHGVYPPYVVEFDPLAVTAGTAEDFDYRNLVTSHFGPILSAESGTENSVGIRLSNLPIGVLHDPEDRTSGRIEVPLGRPGGGDATRFAKVLTTGIRSFVISDPDGTGTTRTDVTDAMGGADASEFAVTNTRLFTYATMSDAALRLNEPLWLEFDLMAGSSNPMAALRFYIQRGNNGPYAFRRVVTVPNQWTRFRFMHPGLRARGVASGGLLFAFDSAYDTSVHGPQTGRVRIGRCRAYHAREPLPERLMLPDAITATTAPAAGSASALPATPAGYVTVNINGTARQVAYY